MTKTEDNPMHLKTGEPSRLRQAPRCLARTRRGTPCQSPAVAGKTRCRMHGGAAGSGAPKGKLMNGAGRAFAQRALRLRITDLHQKIEACPRSATALRAMRDTGRI